MMTRRNKAVPLVAVVGRSNSGKTTLIEKLVSIFAGQGLKVAVIKHVHHDFEFDVPGKDTHRHKAAGASTVILASGARIGMVKDLAAEVSLDDIIGYTADCDLLIVEGFKREPTPKIEVFTSLSKEPPLCLSGDGSYIAVVTDDDLDAAIPRFSRDDADGVARFITSRILNRGDA